MDEPEAVDRGSVGRGSRPIVIHADRIVDGRGNVTQNGSDVVTGGKITSVDKTPAGLFDV